MYILLILTLAIITLSITVFFLKRDFRFRQRHHAFVHELKGVQVEFVSNEEMRKGLNYFYSTDKPSPHTGRHVILDSHIQSWNEYVQGWWGDANTTNYRLHGSRCECGTATKVLHHQFAPTNPRWEHHIPFRKIASICLKCLRTESFDVDTNEDEMALHMVIHAAERSRGIPSAPKKMGIYR